MALGINRHFSVSKSAWTKGTVERIFQEVVRALHAVLVEREQPLGITVLPPVQWVLKTAWRTRTTITPFILMHGWEA